MYVRYCCHSWGLQVRQKFHKKSNHGDFLYINEQVVTLQKFVMFLSVAIEKSWHLLSPGCAVAQPSYKNQKVLSYFDWNIKFLTILRDINATTISDVHESARRFLKAWCTLRNFSVVLLWTFTKCKCLSAQCSCIYFMSKTKQKSSLRNAIKVIKLPIKKVMRCKSNF